MTSGQKIAFSLLASIALFAGFVFVSQSKLFPELETKYYAQSKIEEKTVQLNKIAESTDSYISNVLKILQGNQDAYLNSAAVSSYLSQNPSEKDVITRREQTEKLFTVLPGLEGIRLVDKNGRNVHFTTYDRTDIFKQSGISKIYKNYPDIQKDADELSFDQIRVNDQKPENRIILDPTRNRLILSLPFYWNANVYAGSMVFYFNVMEMENVLVTDGAISLGSSFNMFADDSSMKGGFAIGVPSKTRNEFIQPILNNWKLLSVEKGEVTKPERILQISDDLYWVSLSTISDYFKISGIYTSDIFELSDEFIYLIYGAAFLTILLIVYLLFSLKSDSMVTLKKRIKKIQYSVVKEYINNKEDVDWNKVVSQLRTRKDDLTSDIIKSLRVHSKKKRKELNEILDKNWDEIFAITSTGTKTSAASASSVAPVAGGVQSGVTLDEIRRMLEEVLKTTKVSVQAPVVAAPVAKVEEIEEVEELDDVEEIEEIDEVEKLDDVEEIEEIDEVEELDDVEEIEEIDEVEELDEVEEIEEVEELDDVEEIEEIDEVEELDDVEEIEEVEELDDVEEIEEIEEVEELDDVEEIEEVEEIDEVEELDDVEEIEEVEEVEELDDVEEIEELDEVEEIEELDDVPPAAPAFNLEALLTNNLDLYEYRKSNDTFISSDSFPTTDNLFAEEITLGEQCSPNWSQADHEFSFQVYTLETPIVENISEELPEEVEELTEDVEELTEEVVDPYFAMTSFANNVDDVESLEGTAPETIIENEGVFSISDTLEYTDIVQDSEFKSLVDSVLQ